MKPGRRSFTIADLMAATVILACDLGAIRALRAVADSPRNLYPILVTIALPMVGLLTLGGWVVIRSRLLGTTVPPFLIGFEVVGCAATALYLALAGQAGSWVAGYIEWAMTPLEPYFPYFEVLSFDAPDWSEVVAFVIEFLPVFVPEMVAAVIGGAFTHRYRIVRRRPPEPRAEGVEARS